MAPLNLARRPFRNRRPVFRISMLVWALALGLLALNGWLYWDFLAGKGSAAEQIRQLDENFRQETERTAAARDEVQRFDLRRQNQQVAFLNQKIAARNFAWSGIFDRFAGIVPRDVRLVSVSPLETKNEAAQDSGTGRGRDEATASRFGLEDGRVYLRIAGSAKDGDAILKFLDRLYADSAFERPKLRQENDNQDGERRFNLEVFYRPTEEAMPAIQPVALSRTASSSAERF